MKTIANREQITSSRRRILRMYAFSVMIAVFGLVSCCYAQVPGWVSGMGSDPDFPEVDYLTGFGMAKAGSDGTEADCYQIAMDNAKRNLVEKVRVTIESSVMTKTEESGDEVAEYFAASTHSNTSLELPGFNSETYYDEDKGVCYAFAYVERNLLVDEFDSQEGQLRGTLTRKFTTGKKAEDGGDRTRALREYLGCFPLLQQLGEKQSVLRAIRGTRAVSIADTAGAWDISLDSIEVAVDRVIQKPINTLDDIAWHIAYSIRNQVPDSALDVMVTPFTFEDTKMGSPFSKYFNQILSSKWKEMEGVRVVSQENLGLQWNTGRTRDVARGTGPSYVLEGTIWKGGEGYRFIPTLRSVTAMATMGATVVVPVPDSVVEFAELPLTPGNFNGAIAERNELRRGEVAGGSMGLDVTTNKGTENLVYSQGERMEVYVRVSVPSYIRLVYHLADGRNVLLLKNHYIDESFVNKKYKIPEEFVCDEPFGAEVLQIFARTEPFEDITTVSSDGYEIIKEELPRFLATTRGMKKAKKETVQSETRIVLTTTGN